MRLGSDRANRLPVLWALKHRAHAVLLEGVKLMPGEIQSAKRKTQPSADWRLYLTWSVIMTATASPSEGSWFVTIHILIAIMFVVPAVILIKHHEREAERGAENAG